MIGIDSRVFLKTVKNTCITEIRGLYTDAGNNCRSRKEGKCRMRWMDDIKSVTGLSVNGLNQLVKERKSGNY